MGKATKFALIIGNERYKNPKYSLLNTPGTDARELADLLQSPEIGGFSVSPLLIDANEAKISRAIERFFLDKAKTKDDLLLLFLSGHGVKHDDGLLYFAVRDTDPKLLLSTAISANFLKKVMEESRSKRQVLILDCCFSGAFTNSMKSNAGSLVDELTEIKIGGYGRVILTATNSYQFALEQDVGIGNKRNSFFTHYLLKGLRNGDADLNNDGEITVDEWYQYAYEETIKANPFQTPTKITTPEEGSMVIARNPWAFGHIPSLFEKTSFTNVVKGADLPGYSKQTSLVRDSTGCLTLFARFPNGNLAFVKSHDEGHSWGKPKIFDQIPQPGGPQISAVIDNLDRIHAVWGRAPEAGEVEYGLLDNDSFVKRETIATGVYARNIAVDSQNNAHIVWSNVDISYMFLNNNKKSSPQSIAEAMWHPDIKISSNDEIYILTNSGAFYPTPGVSVFEISNAGGEWKRPTKISTSPFWSGAISAVFDSKSTLYATWIGATSYDSGPDQVFFSQKVNGRWHSPHTIGNVNWSATSTGQESPAIAIDINEIIYILWRGLNAEHRGVIFLHCLNTGNHSLGKVRTGWSPIIELDVPEATDAWWPTIAHTRKDSRVAGVDIAWTVTINQESVIKYAHITFPSTR